MEKETCTSKKKELLTEEFLKIAKNVKDRYNISIQLVEIMGKRWSFIAGEEEEDIFLPPQRIQINEKFGVVSGGWEKVSSADKEKIISMIRKVVEKYG